MILIVEDNPVDSAVMVAFLEKIGHDCMIARSAEDALEFCAESPPDMIIADVHLPGESGIGLCKRIKAKESPCCDIPFLIISSDVKKLHTALEALAAGAKNFVPKPIQKDRLLSAVWRCLAIADAQQKRVEFSLSVKDKLRGADGL